MLDKLSWAYCGATGATLAYAIGLAEPSWFQVVGCAFLIVVLEIIKFITEPRDAD